MVQHQTNTNPITTPTSQLPDTMSYLATFTMPQYNDQDDVLLRLRTVPNPNPDSDPLSSSSYSSSSSSNLSLSDSSDSADSSLCLIFSDKERKKARKTNRRRVKRRKQRAYTILFTKNRLCKAAHHHKLKALRLEGDPKSKRTATILWIETIKDVL